MHVQYSSLSLYYTAEFKKNNFPHGARSSAVSSEDTQRLSPHLGLQSISGTFGFRTLLAFSFHRDLWCSSQGLLRYKDCLPRWPHWKPREASSGFLKRQSRNDVGSRWITWLWYGGGGVHACSRGGHMVHTGWRLRPSIQRTRSGIRPTQLYTDCWITPGPTPWLLLTGSQHHPQPHTGPTLQYPYLAHFQSQGAGSYWWEDAD